MTHLNIVPLSGTVISSNEIKGKKRNFHLAKLEWNNIQFNVVAFSKEVYKNLIEGVKVNILAALRKYEKNDKDYISIVAIKAEPAKVKVEPDLEPTPEPFAEVKTVKAKPAKISEYEATVLSVEAGGLTFKAKGRTRKASAEAELLKELKAGDQIKVALKKTWRYSEEGRKAVYIATSVTAA